jgi:putative restriction endonuclease
LAEFLRAWEAGVFEGRTELVDGQVWPVPIGTWHGDTAAKVLRALPNDEHLVSTALLPTADSLPDPDCWVRRATAQPTTQLSERVSAWSATDVLLVVEIADETLDQDLGPKANLYARAGYPCYWGVTHDGVYVHTDPTPAGYRTRVLYPPTDRLPVPYANVQLSSPASSPPADPAPTMPIAMPMRSRRYDQP